MTPLDILWYSRSAHPCPLGLAAQLGGFIDEFRDDPFRVFTVQESPDAAIRESHVDHHLPNFIRQGGNAPALWARSCGAKTRLIGLSWMDEFQGILTLPGSGIQSVADLAGRCLALPLSDSLIDTARAEALHGFLIALRTQQLGPSDVKFSDLPVHRSSASTPNQKLPPGLFGEYARQMGALLRREVDAVYVKGARGLQAARTAQAHVVIDLRSHPDAKSRVHNGTPRPITVDEGLLKSHPEVVERFLARVLAAGEWASQHPSETVAYLARETRRSEELVVASYGPQVHQHLTTDLSTFAVDALIAHQRYLLEWGFIPRDFDIHQWIAPQPLLRAKERLAGELLLAL
jgi:ABC-type nitrate/sulfonate/bicarbonate transport system substrate-binding protein